MFAATPILGGLLLGGYGAMMTEHSREALQNTSAAASVLTAPPPSDLDAEFEGDMDPARRRDFLDRFSGVGPGGVSPEDFATARARAHALPPSPLLQGRKFNPAQATAGETPSTSWISPIQPPIVDGHYFNSKNSSRIDTFAFHPSNTNVVYAGGSGGLLQSTDGGGHWAFLSDNWESQAITSIAVDPSAPDHVYVGTGSFAFGVGLYRSTDAGMTWILLPGNCPTCQTNVPVFAETSIRKVAVDSPSSGTIVYAITGPSNTHSSELWRSTDSGEHWSQLPHPGSSGEIRDLAIDYLTSPSHLYIGADNGVFKSTNGGLSWSNLNWNSSCISLSVVQSVPYLLAPNAGANRLYYYAAGAWTEIRTICPAGVEPAICSSVGASINPWNFAVDPSNPNIILIGTNGFFRTTNATAGANATWQDIRGQSNHDDIHFDQRAIAFSGAIPGLVYTGNDGGIWKSTVDGALNTWNNLNQNLPGALLYSVALSQDGSMMAGTQDNGAIFSNAGAPWGIVLGGDAYQALIHSTNSEFSYYTSNSGSFRRYIKSTGADSDIRPPNRPCWGWSMNPLAPERITANCMPVARTGDATVTPVVWQSIGSAAPSPGSAVTGAREAPSDPNVIYAIENQSKVWVTANANAGTPAGAGASWATRYTHGGINNFVVDPTNPSVAYLACNDAVHKTTDMGLTWTIHGIPNLIYRDLVIDPSHPNQIIAATNAGVLASIDAGETWGYMSDGIPAGMLVTSLSFNNAARQVAASTYGRGAYILNLGDVLVISTPTPSPTPSPSPSPTPTPTPTPTPLPIMISGTLVYCSNPGLNPLPGVTLTLIGNGSASTLSNSSGNYLFFSLASGGSYIVIPSMTARAPGTAGINTVDVVAVQRHFLAIALLPAGCPRTAADVNVDTSINTADVIAMQRFALGLSTGIALTGIYQFSPASRSYLPLSNNQTAQNYDTLILGDVVSNFVHRPGEGNDASSVGEVAAPPEARGDR